MILCHQLLLYLIENLIKLPKCQFFVATIICQHCLNPLGHGVHQSFTGCHWSPLSLLHDDITELVDVRDFAILHLLFEDAPQIAFPLSFFFVFGVVIMLEYCPAAQSPKERDHALLHCHSTCWHSWFPQ